MNTFHDHIIEWEAPEFIQHEKGWRWFLVAGLIALGFMIYAVLSGNWTFALVILVIVAIYYYEHGRTPQHIQVLVSRTGIKIGDKEYTYQNIKSFWIIYKPGQVKTLNLRSNSRLLSDVSIDLDGQDPAELRTFLCAHVKEEEGKEETFTESLIRILKL